MPRVPTLVALALLALASSPAFAYQEMTVGNGGSIKGRITYSGPVPMKQIVPNNPEVCGGPRKDPQIQIGENNGVTDAVVFLQDVSKGKPWPEKKPARLDNKDCRFEPQMLAMQPGTLVISNDDDVLHNTHVFYGRRTAINLGLPNKGMEITRKLERPGLLRIECDQHGHMHAAGYVAANPYYAVPGKNGEFEITGIPPGEYTAIVYQRTAGQREVKVTVKAGAATDLSVDLAKK